MKRVFREADFGWEGIEPSGYGAGRSDAPDQRHRGVTRHVISGAAGEPSTFSVRYFEVAPGGFTRLEKHEHVHSVTVLRGRGEALVGEHVHAVRPFDHIYVAPLTLHQFINESAEPFGFLCVVDAQRDRPQPATAGEIAALEANANTAGKIRV